MRGNLLDNHSEHVRKRTQAAFLNHDTLIGTSEPGRKKATGTATHQLHQPNGPLRTSRIHSLVKPYKVGRRQGSRLRRKFDPKKHGEPDTRFTVEPSRLRFRRPQAVRLAAAVPCCPNVAQRLKPAFAYMHALCPCSQWAIEARVQLRQPVCFQCTEALVREQIGSVHTACRGVISRSVTGIAEQSYYMCIIICRPRMLSL